MTHEVNAAFETPFMSTILRTRDSNNNINNKAESNAFIAKLLQRQTELENTVSLLSQRLLKCDPVYGSAPASPKVPSPCPSTKYQNEEPTNEQQQEQSDFSIRGNKNSLICITNLNQLPVQIPGKPITGLTLKYVTISSTIFHQFLTQVSKSLEKLVLDKVTFIGSNPRVNKMEMLRQLEEFKFVGNSEDENVNEEDIETQLNLQFLFKRLPSDLRTLSLSQCPLNYDLLVPFSKKLISIELSRTLNCSGRETLHTFLLQCSSLQNLTLCGRNEADQLNFFCLPYSTLRNLKLKDYEVFGIPEGEMNLDLGHLDTCTIDPIIAKELGTLLGAKGLILQCDDALQGYNVLGSLIGSRRNDVIAWVRLVGFHRQRILPDPSLEEVDRFLSSVSVPKYMDTFTLLKDGPNWTLD